MFKATKEEKKEEKRQEALAERREDRRQERADEVREQAAEVRRAVKEEEKAAFTIASRTVDDVLAALADKPRPITFNSIRAGGYAVAIGDKVFKFKDHDFITSDPAEVRLLMKSDRYGYDFFVLDAELRKAIR